MIGQSIENYAIEAVLGHGGMGIVYKALDTSLDRVVALKVMNPGVATNEEFLWRFKSEARVLGRLQHANIVNVYAFRHIDPHLFIVMEYVGGGTLSHLIERQGIVQPRQALPIMKQCLHALEVAHEANIIHRDIKPPNILLTERGDVKISDFGLAKIQEESSSMMTRVGVTGGTLYYMPPEQSEALSKVDHRGDLYALGMTFYQMLAGRMPFNAGSSAYSILKAVAEEQIPSPDTFNQHMPPGLVDIVMRAIKKDPDQRYQSARAMREALEAFEAEQRPAPAKTPARPPAADKTVLFTPDDLPKFRSPPPRPKDNANGAAPALETMLPGETATSRPAGARIRLYAVAALAVVLVAVALYRFIGNEPSRTSETPPAPLVAENDPAASGDLDGAASGNPSSDNPASPPSDTGTNPGGQAPVERPTQPENAVYEITINSTPSGAQVVFDGKRQGTTPLTVPNLPAGTYPVELRLNGYQRWAGSLNPQERTSVTAILSLQLVATRVVVRPWGSLFVNGDKKLDSDVAAYEDRLAPGRYTMRATSPLGTWEKLVQIRPGDENLLILFNFEPEYSLTVSSPPITNAEIFVDGVAQGVHTPSTIRLHPGNHTIEVRKDGYRLEGGPRSLTLEEDLKEPIAFTLVEANRE